MQYLHFVATSAFILCVTPALALAGEPQFEAPAGPPVSPDIQGGQVATACQWPTSVAVLNGTVLCAGTLVHPRVVTTAAHCVHPMYGGTPGEIRFGEEAFEPALAVPVDFCMYSPEWSGGVSADDHAFCVMAEPVDLPPTPPMMGCELDELTPGAEVAIVGYGNQNDNDGAGTKRWGYTTIQPGTDEQFIIAGDDAVSTCLGDMGGSGYYQMEDGGWRSWGVASGGPAGCGNETKYASMSRAAEWIEANSGYDITPCHDADGTWNPGPECDGFASDPTAGGSWDQQCSGPVGSAPATCGPPADFEDLVPPDVAFVVPMEEQIFAEDSTTLDVTVEADDPDYAVVKVELYIDGMYNSERTRDAWEPDAPWLFEDVSFSAGTYTLTAIAYDVADKSSEAEVTFHVGEAAGDGDGDPGDGDGDGSADTGDEAGDTGTSGAPILPVDDAGCSCSESGRGSGGAPLGLGSLLLLGLASVRRSRWTPRRETLKRETL